MVSKPRKGQAAKDILEDLMSQKVPIHADFASLENLGLTQQQRKELTYEDVFWATTLSKACHGDMKAIGEVLDRRFGKSPQHIIQENFNYNYVDFLEQCAARDQEEETRLIDVEPQVVTEVPSGLSDEGGSSGNHGNVMSDLGLLDDE